MYEWRFSKTLSRIFSHISGKRRLNGLVQSFDFNPDTTTFGSDCLGKWWQRYCMFRKGRLSINACIRAGHSRFGNSRSFAGRTGRRPALFQDVPLRRRIHFKSTQKNLPNSGNSPRNAYLFSILVRVNHILLQVESSARES